ncbi:MAG: hypothetical protein K2I74_10405, partial [Treponemataceae bacterium]|nr:hypothetical protein [Treponemataceae bacterium]
KTNAQWRQQFMTWEQEMKEQVKERAEVLALELVEERAEELAQELAEERAEMLAQELAEEMAQERAEEIAAQKDIETARRMLDKDIAMEIIADVTGLPLAQVERLQAETMR